MPTKINKLFLILVLIACSSTSLLAQSTAPRKRIFFGDLHTHTNLSSDAMLVQALQGVSRGPEAVCTYARACAQVDFYGQSDHAEMLDVDAWSRTVKAVKECNASAAQSGQEPELVAFQGFEWTSSAVDKYWGHKNVFFRNDAVPELPIGSYIVPEMNVGGLGPVLSMMEVFRKYQVGIGAGLKAASEGARLATMERCIPGGPLMRGCVNVADDPGELFERLNSYYGNASYSGAGYDALVIPHGTAWGMAKVGTDWTIQNNPRHHDPNLQRLIEVYSGHGNSEEYRDFRDPASQYESCSKRAGRLEWAHCKRGGGSPESCRSRATEAAEKVQVSFATTPADWGMCGECPDCFQPAERYQPQGSVQAALAMSGFAPDGTVQTRYNFGFISATDDHSARAASVMEDKRLTDWQLGAILQAGVSTGFAGKGRNTVEAERVASFLYPGGLVAVHAQSRTREAIWDGLKNREVYGTSGPRMEVWFDAQLGAQTVPMGSTVQAGQSPRFVVEAYGAPVEQAGCSEATRERWGDDVISNVCLNTCYNPGNQRTGIDRIEVIRITPQITAAEKIGDLIRDPYLVIPNANRDARGQPRAHFKAEFTDAEFAGLKRDALYYVRVIQTPTEGVNGTPGYNARGEMEFCPTEGQSQCKTPINERAWSSPIYVNYRP